MTALLSMYEKWVMAARNKQVSGVVLVDLSAAFDLVSPSLLIEKLKVYGFEEDLTTWIYSYLTERYQSVWIDHVFSDFLENSIGVPQGSNLGPLFFLIYFNDLPTFIKEDIDCYADDSTLGATDKVVANIGTKLSSDCNQLSKWMDQNKFKLNADKTHFMVMGTAARLRGADQLDVVMDGVVLEESEEQHEVLPGVVIQSDLKWTLQLEELSAKLTKRLTGLMKLKYLMKRSNKRNIIQGVFSSVLCYCLPLFGGCSKADLNVIQVQQNKAAQIALNCPPRTSRKLMFDSLDWLTVKQLIAYHTIITVYKIRNANVPEDLAEILNKENHNGHIVVKNTQLELYRCSFVFRGSVLWNNLPRSLRTESKLSQFKKLLRGWIMENVERFG